MSTAPETRPVPIVVLAGTVVHRASAVRQITGPRPARHATNSTPAAVAADAGRGRHRLDRLIRGGCWMFLAVEVTKTGGPGWLLGRLADGLMVAVALAGR